MKYCPTCGTKYDEEVLRFCMKDGTPLLEEKQPNFVEMPSESLEADVDDDDAGEVTVIRRNVPVPPPPVEEDFSSEPRAGERIVVPTYQDRQGQAPPRTIPYQAPPRKTNTALVVLLTIIGTVTALGLVGGAIWLFTSSRSDNTNVNNNLNLNANQNVNVNTNLGIDTNFNFNMNANVNMNVNANVKTPTPTPRPSPSVTPSPSPSPSPDEDGTPSNGNTRPRATPTPLPTPPVNRPPVNGGVLNGRATSLTTPSYPAIARTAGASGLVRVQVLVDERGNVISANAVSGHPLLRGAAEAAARSSKITPSQVGGQPARTTGVLQYNFRSN